MPKEMQKRKKDNAQRLTMGDLRDKATKRVIAPFIHIVRKPPQPEDEETKFAAYLKKKPSVLIRDLSAFLSDSVDLTTLLHDTAEVLKNITKASSVVVYLVDMSRNELFHSKKTLASERHKIRWRIGENSTVAAHVASRKVYVMVDDIMEDDRFPDGIGYGNEAVKAVLCLPVVTPNGDCFAVLEMSKHLFDTSFTGSDLRISVMVTAWMGIAIHENSQRLALQRQQELNDYLLDLTKCFFGEAVSMEKLMSEIVKLARVTLNSERSSIFVIDQESGDDLVADFFEDTATDAQHGTTKKPQKVRFTKERGIVGLVTRTGCTVNVKDVYTDARFGKEVDQKSGPITRSILCVPIKSVDKVVGLIQVVNKKSGGYFTGTDEMLLKTFGTYCSLALRYTEARTNLKQMEHWNNIYLRIVKLQVIPCTHDMRYYTQHSTVTLPRSFEKCTWYINDEQHHTMPQLCLYILYQLIDKSEMNLEKTMQYILSVRKFYRNNPFHNYEHAFNVLHCMYYILKQCRNKFSPIEIKALLLASMNHDLDHGGYTNNFLEHTSHDLAHLYEQNIWENHHYTLAMLILKEIQPFQKMTPDEFEEMSREIKDAILATDLQQYFINRTKLQKVTNFDWNNSYHKTLLKRVMMTCCDLSAVCKPFLVAKRVTDNLYVEFYKQGDKEMEMGLCPLSTMDREKIHMIPEDQVNFINIVALPGYLLLKQIIPSSASLYEEAQYLMGTWQDVIVVRGKKCWRQDDSIVQQGFVY